MIDDVVLGIEARRNRSVPSSDTPGECLDAAPTTKDAAAASLHRSATSFDPTEWFADRTDESRDGGVTIHVISASRMTTE